MVLENGVHKVNIGVIGLGKRGICHLSTLLDMDDINVTAVCELYEDRLAEGIEMVEKSGRPKPRGFKDYNDLLKCDEIDGVIIPSSWTTHSEISIAAMKAGKYTATEVGGAASIDECWQLVKTSEETKIPCMMLENACYVRNEMAILNMVTKNIFGELIHCQCGYEHDLRDEVALGKENRHYRLINYINRNGDVYPTHGVGPWAKCLNINSGNRFISLTSMASKSRGLHEWIQDNLGKEHTLAQTHFEQGDIVTTMIKCAHGETIFIIHDTTLPRPYSRGGRVQGTKGLWMEDGNNIYIEGRGTKHTWESFDAYREEFDHPLWKEYKSLGVRGGHDGADYLCLRAFIESIKQSIPTPIDVYDTAAWMAITALSEQSVAMGSIPLAFPDFTNGKWIERTEAPASKYSLNQVCEELFT